MKKFKLFPSPHIEVIIHTSDQMKKDMEECWCKAFGNGKECDTCSWNEVHPFGINMCTLPELVNKILGEDCTDITK